MTETPITQGSDAIPDWDRTATAPAVRENLSPWWLLLVLGITSILFGVAVLVWPDVTLRVMAVLVGLWLLLAGIARVVGAFVSGRGVGAQVLSGLIGLLLIVGGVACLRNLVTGLLMLATIVAFMWLFSGLSELVLAFTATGSSRTWLLLLGAVSTLIGFAFLVWPGLSLTALVVMTGIGALIIGAAEVVFAFRARRLSATA